MLKLPTTHYKPNPGSSVNGEKCNSKLFTPIKIKNTVIKNRIFLAPMDQYSADVDGKPNMHHLVHYGAIAQRGAGLVLIEATAVKKNGRITYADIGLWEDEQIEAFKPIVDYIHYHGAIAGVQLAHSGRKGSVVSDLLLSNKSFATKEENGWPDEIVAPSAIPFTDGWIVPNELTKKDINNIAKSFGDAARRANEAGIDVIEIHAAHGYLIHEFLSPISNKRTDEYGGSFENRIRFCTEVIQEIKAQWPKEKPIFIRFSCTDYVEGGWDVEQTSKLTKIVQSLGVDFVDCSSGGLSPNQKIDFVGPSYQVPFAEEIKKQNPSMLVGSVGIIIEGKQAESVLSKGIDVISVGRPFLINTSLVLDWAEELNEEIEWPRQFMRGKRTKKFRVY